MYEIYGPQGSNCVTADWLVWWTVDVMDFSWHYLQPQIYTRDTRLPILPCAMVSSAMGLNLGSSGFCLSHTQKQMQNKCIHNLRARIVIPLYTRTWRTTIILITGKIWRPLNWAPCRDQDGTGSGIIGVYLHLQHCLLTTKRPTICKRRPAVTGITWLLSSIVC